MSRARTFLGMAAAVAGLVTGLFAGLGSGPARAGDWMPLLPNQDFYDFQLFAPPDLNDYEIYAEPSEGIFFSYDRLYWSITPPSINEVGRTQLGGYLIPSQPISPQSIVQLNNGGLQSSGTTGQSVIGGIYIFGADPLQLDLNTSWMRTAMTWGNRYEGGWIYDGRGVALSYFDSGPQTQKFQTNSEFAASSPTQIFTQTTTSGGGGGGAAVTNSFPLTTVTLTSNSPPPDHIIAQKFTQENYTRIQSAGASFIVRRELGRRGSGTTARFALGPRFMQFEDRYTLGYESNQYAFNRGPTGTTGGTGSGVNIQTTGGGQQASAQQTGGAFGNTGASNINLSQSSAGDVLGITGNDTLTGRGVGSPLQTGFWETATYNNLVGPEFAVLLEASQGRWTFLTELKFTAGFNWQNNLYRGSNFPDSIGADYLRATFNPSATAVSGGFPPINETLVPPPLFLQLYGVGQSNATNSVEHRFVFSPIGEWRFGTQFRVSQAITLHAGYTGMVLGSIARASSNTGYRSTPQATKYAEPLNPTTPATTANPWVVKTTGAPPPGATAVAGDPNTFKDAAGNYYTGVASPYHRDDPLYNRIGPALQKAQDIVFTNGVDFGIEVKY